MRFLLDTHTVLWLRADNPALNRNKWEPLFFGSEHEILVSKVSLWEMTIKRSLGKLDFDGNISDFSRGLTESLGFRLLDIDANHLSRLEELKFHHRDPFDRLLIAQAIEVGATAVTNDSVWQAYPVAIDW